MYSCSSRVCDIISGASFARGFIFFVRVFSFWVRVSTPSMSPKLAAFGPFELLPTTATGLITSPSNHLGDTKVRKSTG